MTLFMTRINTMNISNGTNTTVFKITLIAQTQMKFADYALFSIAKNLSIQGVYTRILHGFGQVRNSH